MNLAVASSRKTKIEDEKADVESVSSESEDEHVHDEHCGHGPSRTIGRKERAARKEIAKVAALQSLSHIKRVTFKRHNGPVFVINQVEVYYDKVSGSYILFGPPMIEAGGMGGVPSTTQRMAAHSETAELGSKVTVQDDDELEESNDNDGHEEGRDEEIDANGVDEKDIAIVMDQAHVSRAKAIRALRANGNDIVNTIMDLTM